MKGQVHPVSAISVVSILPCMRYISDSVYRRLYLNLCIGGRVDVQCQTSQHIPNVRCMPLFHTEDTILTVHTDLRSLVALVELLVN
jgi:hypothetical protein